MAPRKSARKSAAKHQPVRVPSPKSPTLPTLPNEVIYQIISYLDPPTACAFARTTRVFNSAAESRVWHRLSLHLPENYGEPLYYYDAPKLKGYETRSNFQKHMEKKQERQCEDAYRSQLRTRVRQMLMRGNERRWKGVREVVMMPRPGAVNAMIQMLDLVSEGLKSLEILGAGDYRRHHLRPADHETFYHRMVNYELYFPNLTHIRLLDNPLRFREVIPLLCNASPNLISLTADLENDFIPDVEPEDLIPPFPDFNRPTRLRVLRLDFQGDSWRQDGTSFTKALIDILKSCPELEEVAINWDGKEEERPGIGKILGGMKKLRDLVWLTCASVGAICLVEDDGRGQINFPQIKRVSMKHDDHLPLIAVPQLSHMETLVLCDYGISEVAPYPEILETQAFIPSLARQVRRSVRLHEIRTLAFDDDTVIRPTDFDGIDDRLRTGTLTGEISSYRHGDEEVLHARMLEDKIDVSDTPYLPGSRQPYSSFRYTAADGSERVRGLEWLDSYTRSEDEAYVKFVTWRDYTDYRGELVPMEVLSRMREVQGASEDEWVGRGIEVGDAAWQVLLDWKAEPKVEPVGDLPSVALFKRMEMEKKLRIEEYKREEAKRMIQSEGKAKRKKAKKVQE